ncbi:DUF6059 family protein [Kitasatospora sp. NPDC052896]|uniref:DUF6059 family protein n=1 Tax=Kitasatospora sp. NPDC052896 TaxID=3364061 RepID=UPI0037C85F2F
MGIRAGGPMLAAGCGSGERGVGRVGGPARGWLAVVTRVLQPVWQGFVMLGVVSAWGSAGVGEGFAQTWPVRVDGLPPGHPEMLRPDLPLTPTELALSRELASCDWWLPEA